MSKEAYTSVKRGLYQCQKRPILVSKEAYTSVKRGLIWCFGLAVVESNAIETDSIVPREQPFWVLPHTIILTGYHTVIAQSKYTQEMDFFRIFALCSASGSQNIMMTLEICFEDC